MKLLKAVKTNSSVKLLTLCCLIGMSLSLSAHAQERGDRDMPKRERPAFSTLDLNSDGAVSFAEFEQSDVPNNEHSTIFGHIDADGDGVLTEEEFTSHKPPRRDR
ncbi:MAG: EF-hand domain-containing protein [Paraglaciecola sp.]|uniref:EF-hand domain-containing protein n=1 Tax=Paraglaciecola sp. TaxID=1920173 RepID=UPI003297D88E